MKFTFTIVQDLDYGGVISPNNLKIDISGEPFTAEDNQKYIYINYTIAFVGGIGVGNDLRYENILYRSETTLVPFQVIGLLTDVETYKPTINGFLSQFTFKGFLKDFVLQIA